MELNWTFVILACILIVNATLFRGFSIDKYVGFQLTDCDVGKAAFVTFHTASLMKCARTCSLQESCLSFFYTSRTAVCSGCTESYRRNETDLSNDTLYFNAESVGDTSNGVFSHPNVLYKGCFSSYCNPGIPCVSLNSHFIYNMTPLECYEACKTFDTFGIEGIMCYCGFEPTEANSSGCTDRCPGNDKYICGAASLSTMYSIV